MSPSLKRLVNVFGFRDTFRYIEPNTRQYSRCYSKQSITEGATRLDRIYISNKLEPTFKRHNTISILDHLSFEVKFNINEDLQKLLAPKPKISFKIKQKIIDSEDFQETIAEKLSLWKIYLQSTIITKLIGGNMW